ncbi:MAG TPA: alpha/beta hydrolase [Beijerinckiaceae bacterium]|jgi:predicted alpha/beta hydrolase family esterase
MRIADCDVIIIPGLGGSGPDHWQSRWEAKLSTARRVEQDDWDAPSPVAWAERILETVSAAERPVVLVAHSLGVVAAVEVAPLLPEGRVRGAFLVSLPDVEDEERTPPETWSFAPIPRGPLPFPSVLVASRTDPYCAYERAEDFAYAWGAAFVDAGDAGHINVASEHGPWPEGLMRFAGFMKLL